MASASGVQDSTSVMDSPDSLFDITMDCLVDNIDTVTEIIPGTSRRRIRENVTLPYVICEQFLEAYQRKHRLDDSLLYAFIDHKKTRFQDVKLRNAKITDEDLLILLEHKPRILELIRCDKLTYTALNYINEHCENLVSLKIGPLTDIIPNEDMDYKNRGFFLSAPKLKNLTVWRRGVALFPLLLLRPLTYLKYLDLSDCTSLGHISCLREMEHLEVLILHNVYWLQDVIEWIMTIKSLRHLDISQSNDRYGKYYSPNEVLSDIVTNLTNLVALDISGTNLAGSGVAWHSFPSSSNQRCDIPGLVSRVDRPLEFLGLYGTQYSACKRHDIPAITITGDANEEQILTAAKSYVERPEILTRVMNDLYHLFRNDSNTQTMRALSLILEAMEKHISEKHVQISGSATLFYIVKGKEKERLSIRLKKRIIRSVLVGMEIYNTDETVLRNGCLTLCQFKIPSDVLFEYERLVKVLLHGVTDRNQEGFVQRISIYLLNSLACQVDGARKKYLGNQGTINKMLYLIENRLQRSFCDDVLEVAWSTMWNVTDETPENSERFLNAKGLDYFLQCLTAFPEKEELLRNMMGLLGNVAEVPELRQWLKTPTLIKVFYELLDSASDGIEVSYNAAGVLAHLASDGAQYWSVPEPVRSFVLQRVAIAVERWDLHAERNINYRSFEPILKLLTAYHTPQCIHWAVWALANLTNVYPERYCRLIEKEGGIDILQAVICHPSPYDRITELAAEVLQNCRMYMARRTVDGISRPNSPENN